jgi:hypothetical protein
LLSARRRPSRPGIWFSRPRPPTPSLGRIW